MALSKSDSVSQATDPLHQLLALGRTLIMGILNVTPDSFSDGGRFLDPDIALDHARRMIAEGADIIDVGAESTRPYGAVPITVKDEVARLEPVLPVLAKLVVPLSIDTMKAKVAAWAIENGASIVNDVWGLQRDPDMARVVAEHGVPIIVTHNRETADPSLEIMADIAAFFSRSLAIAERAGIARERVVLDPGIGFGKTPAQSLTVITRLAELQYFDLPLLVGASRKRFISAVAPSEPQQRLGGSLAAHLMAVLNGATIIRAHDVAETVQAMQIAAAIIDAR